MAKLCVADVCIDSRTAGTEAVYTYAPPVGETPRAGQAFAVPLGARQALGYVVAVREVEPDDLGFPPERLRPLGGRVPGMDLPQSIVGLVTDVASQTLSPLPVALTPALPPGSRGRLVTVWSPLGDDGDLTATQRELMHTMRESGELREPKGEAGRGVRSSLRALERRGLAERALRLAPMRTKSGAARYRLTSDDAAIARALGRDAKRKPAQALAVIRLQGSEASAFSKQEIAAMASASQTVVAAMIESRLLIEERGEAEPAVEPPDLNIEQQRAVAAICDAIGGGEHREFLLHGVTGSGKTEVYLRCVAEALRLGRSALYLVPEIALTAQVVAQLRACFGDAVAVLHSALTPNDRLAAWQRIRAGDASVVLGPRSAVFAPLSKLGLIVVDEEHEPSYKQESAPPYDARLLARALAKRASAPLVCGSATPAVESYYAATIAKTTQLLELKRRAVARAALPKIEVVDLREEFRTGAPSILSQPLRNRMARTFDAGHQAILFLNRRGFARALVCRDCGKAATCPNCAVALTMHRRDKRLRCHHCGHETPQPTGCPSCGSSRIRHFGVGGERVEEAVRKEFPSITVARLDRDIAQKRGAMESVFAGFRSGDIQALVGTQMVAKGLDFPNVTLVGVIAADMSLDIPDFRAGERTFQLLSQVAGRAGRGGAPGLVLIQAMRPEDPAIAAAAAHDYAGFFERELRHRKEAKYPPFNRLVNVVVSGANRLEVKASIALVAERLRSVLEEDWVLGPALCPLERLKGVWRMHALAKLPATYSIEPIGAALEGLDGGKTRMYVDVDPQSLM